MPFSGVLIVRKQLFIKLIASDLRILCAQILVAASIILGHITTSQKKKYQKENPLRRGSPAGGKGEKGEQKSGGYAALKRKSPPPFPPRCGALKVPPLWKTRWVYHSGLETSNEVYHTSNTPPLTPLFPSDFLPFREKNIGWEYPYRGLRLSIQQFPISVVIIACPKEIFKPSGQASFTAPCRPFLAGAAVAPAAVQSPDRAAAPSPFQAEDADAPASVLPRSPASDRCRPSDAR